MALEWLSIAMASALVLGAAGAAVRAARSGAREQDDVEAIWQELALRLTAEFAVLGRALLAPRHLVLTWTSDEAVARAEAKVPLDLRAPGHTRVTAPYVLGSGPSFRLTRRSDIDSAGAETEVFADHPVLRARTQLATEMPHAVGRAFGASARERVARFPRQFVLRSEGDAIDLSWDGTEIEPEVIEHALELVAELAKFGVADLRALAGLDGAEYDAEGSGPGGARRPVVRVRRGPGTVELFAERAGVIARVAPRRGLPAFRVRIDSEGVLSGRIPTGVIAPEHEAALPTLGPAIFTGTDQTLEFAWPAPPTTAQADRAVRVLAAWARGSEGAFR